MFLKFAGRPEFLEAGGALVVFHAGVDLSVKSQRIFSRKFFGTKFALKVFLLVVDCLKFEKKIKFEKLKLGKKFGLINLSSCEQYNFISG